MPAIKKNNIWTNLIDSATGESVNFEEVTTWVDGAPMADTKVDNIFFRKLPSTVGGGYVKWVVDENTPYKTTIAEIRSNPVLPYFYKRIVTTDIGQEGEWSADFADSTSPDNTGTILVNSIGVRLKRIHSNFVNVRWFGAKIDGTTDDTQAWQRALNYQNARSLKVIFPSGDSLVSSPLNLNTYSNIQGQGALKSRFLATHQGNVLQYLNGHVISESGSVADWGSAIQCTLEGFGIGSNIALQRDSFNRLLEFIQGNAIHLEGFRYLGFIRNVRIMNGYTKAIYLFGAWGATIDLVEVNRANIGIHVERAGNGLQINRFFGKNLGNMNNIPGLFGAGIYYNGGTNASITNSIIENANTDSGAVRVNGARNFSLRDCYFERQSISARNVRISNSDVVTVDNCNFENTIGIEIDSSRNVRLSSINVYDNEKTITAVLALRILPSTAQLCENITIENFWVNDFPIQRFPVTTSDSLMVMNRAQVHDLQPAALHPPHNRFLDPMFGRGLVGSLRPGVTAQTSSAGMVLTFASGITTSMYTLYSSLYTHQAATGGSLFLICKVSQTGSTNKYISINPTSGSTVTRIIPSYVKNGGYFVCRIPNAQNGVSYSVRFGISATPTVDETLTVTEVYFGFGDHKFLSSVQAASSANTATPVGSSYSQAEVQAILDELRDLKSKMRTAGLLSS